MRSIIVLLHMVAVIHVWCWTHFLEHRKHLKIIPIRTVILQSLLFIIMNFNKFTIKEIWENIYGVLKIKIRASMWKFRKNYLSLFWTSFSLGSVLLVVSSTNSVISSTLNSCLTMFFFLLLLISMPSTDSLKLLRSTCWSFCSSRLIQFTCSISIF